MLDINKRGFQKYDPIDTVVMGQNLAHVAKHKLNHINE